MPLRYEKEIETKNRVYTEPEKLNPTDRQIDRETAGRIHREKEIQTEKQSSGR